jgi:adenylate kinase
MKVYVMVGGPGAGKGTQAQLLAQRLGLMHLSSGDLFRDNIKRKTALGMKARAYMEKGALVPDDMTVQMIDERLGQSDAATGVVLDGFPRTRAQAEALDKMLAKRGAQVDQALFVDIDREEVVRRLSGRWLCSKTSDHVYHSVAKPPKVPGKCDIDGAPLVQRDDDKPETIRARLEQQLPPMYEVVDYYKESGRLSTVNGEKQIQEVSDALLRAIAQTARS